MRFLLDTDWVIDAVIRMPDALRGIDVTRPGGLAVSTEVFAKVRFALHKQGNLIPDMALLIAATALAFDLTLLIRNRRHFVCVPGLRLYQAG